MWERERKKRQNRSRAASPVSLLVTNKYNDDQDQSSDAQWCQCHQDQPISCQDSKWRTVRHFAATSFQLWCIFSESKLYSHTVLFKWNGGSGTSVLARWSVGLDGELIGACRVTFHSVSSGFWVCYIGCSKKERYKWGIVSTKYCILNVLSINTMPHVFNCVNSTSDVYRGAWTLNHRWCKRCIPRRNPSCWPEESRPRWGRRRSRPGGPSGWRSWMGLWGEGGKRWAERGGGERKAWSHGDDVWCDFVTSVFTLTQLLHVALPALEQLHRLRGAAVQGEMVSHTRLEVGCNRGKHIRYQIVWLIDVMVFFFFFNKNQKHRISVKTLQSQTFSWPD